MEIPNYCVIDVRDLSNDSKRYILTRIFNELGFSVDKYMFNTIDEIKYFRIDKNTLSNYPLYCYEIAYNNHYVRNIIEGNVINHFSQEFKDNYKIIRGEHLLNKKLKLINLI